MDVRLMAALISLGIPLPGPGEKHPPLEPYQESGPRRSPRHPGEIDYLYGWLANPSSGRNKRRSIPPARRRP